MEILISALITLLGSCLAYHFAVRHSTVSARRQMVGDLVLEIITLVDELTPTIANHQKGVTPTGVGLQKNREVIAERMKQLSRKVKRVRDELNSSTALKVESALWEWRGAAFGDKSLIIEMSQVVGQSQLLTLDIAAHNFTNRLMRLRRSVISGKTALTTDKEEI